MKLYRLGDNVADGIREVNGPSSTLPEGSREKKDEKWADAVYDLQGRRVPEPAKGLYIQGNKLKIRE